MLKLCYQYWRFAFKFIRKMIKSDHIRRPETNSIFRQLHKNLFLTFTKDLSFSTSEILQQVNFPFALLAHFVCCNYFNSSWVSFNIFNFYHQALSTPPLSFSCISRDLSLQSTNTGKFNYSFLIWILPFTFRLPVPLTFNFWYPFHNPLLTQYSCQQPFCASSVLTLI